MSVFRIKFFGLMAHQVKPNPACQKVVLKNFAPSFFKTSQSFQMRRKVRFLSPSEVHNLNLANLRRMVEASKKDK